MNFIRRSQRPDLTEDEITAQGNESKNKMFIEIKQEYTSWQFFKILIKQNEKEVLQMYYQMYVDNEKTISNFPPYAYEEFITNWEQNIGEYFQVGIKIFSTPYDSRATELNYSREESSIFHKFGVMYEYLLKDCLENISPQIRLAQWKNSQEMNKILDGNE